MIKLHPIVWCLVLVSVCFATSSVGEEPSKTPVQKSHWLPSYLCLTPPCCLKPTPQLPCWNYRQCCDTYCRKPFPCLTTPCLKYCCDQYDCKPFPCPPHGVCNPYPPCNHCKP